MSVAEHLTLTEGLVALGKPFEKFSGIADNECLPVSGRDGRWCLDLIRVLHHLALIEEGELRALRTLAGIAGLTAANQEPDNIIRPNFGGKKNDGEV